MKFGIFQSKFIQQIVLVRINYLLLYNMHFLLRTFVYISTLIWTFSIKPLETIVKNRAGVARPFKNDVYRFTKQINGTYYYVALEGATPMLSFFEAMSYQPSTTWQMKEMKREILFKFYKHLKKLIKQWPPTEDEAELVLYNGMFTMSQYKNKALFIENIHFQRINKMEDRKM